ncbi:MAG: YihY family inner membrane protein [Candidatus Cloacimonetes bacterium]|nr:YihY family inner membrane protein [Candidatus Cloacimonadota bacterium]MCB5286989.1 YihY family inner membrane protein [Candidatus Cloacimonadota bacterium]MCK9183855.1 YihY family inner membrane protein [Candidatus Cloacimonadota bacterium]MCK9583915.1 YihY family inner membrane protein [Candidatus Cloacimonadota bacterium]MDY0229309.1 YihY family inner membrane protein [Candidatus Cloacimonadaceae bacterium]
MGKRKTTLSAKIRKDKSPLIRDITLYFYKIWLHLRIPKRRKAIFNKAYEFMKLWIGRVIKERVPRSAGSLAYVTILGFIPFLTFIVMLAPDLPFLNLKEKIGAVVAENFIPGSADAVMGMINEMISRRMSLNIMVFIILLVSSYALFENIRNTFDHILITHAPERKDILSQFVKFFGTIVFGLLILVLLFSSSSLPIISRLLKLRIFTWLMYIVPFILQFLALFFLYMLMPSIKVKRKSLIKGAFWTTVIWVLVKSGFDYYIYNLTSFQAVYGVIAALPIFLFWIYVNWIIILAGIVLVSVIDKGIREEVIQTQPQKVVRLTLEMYSDSKLNQRLEKFISKNDIKDLVDQIEIDEDKQ